jgi:hypothetical protein
VRDLDKLAKPKVQALLRRAGRTAEITITALSGGEDRLRGVVGWFGRKCKHRLDWRAAVVPCTRMQMLCKHTRRPFERGAVSQPRM